MISQAADRQPASRRIEAIDLARGLALIAMASYHFTWDLEFFGYLEPGTTSHGGWRIYARCIASTFLFLVGVSLYLAHRRGIRWRPFAIRFAQVLGAALAITAITWYAVPSGLIFFGILHEIALASLLGLIFLRLPWFVTAAVAALVIAAPYFARSAMFDAPIWWWLGLSSIDPRSNDYVPIFPWFGAVLIGIAAARLATSTGVTLKVAILSPPRTRPLQFLGRHSLVFYLVHQPVLIAAVWAFAQVAPADPFPPEVQFSHACQAQCRNVRDEAFCLRYCDCMQSGLADNGITESVLLDPTPEQEQTLQGMANLCTEQTDEELATGGAQ